MIHDILFLLAHQVVLCILWYFCANADAYTIYLGDEVEHVHVWCWRAGTMVAVSLGITFAMGWSWLTLLYLLLMSYGGFSAPFRYTLNRLREPAKHWLYIAPWSNVYDRVFYLFAGGTWLLPDLYAMEADWYKKNIAGTKTCVHRAGRLAYVTETIAYLTGLVGLVYQLLNPALP